MAGSALQSLAQPQLSNEESIKKNTDCVYFLASPLTCKKGSECEYRHSDVARLNPRDCWYWLHSKCLNSKCAFRHLPLDGLIDHQTPTSTVSSGSMPHSVNSSTKSSKVPCVFYQKGHCFKGEWCQFLHLPSSSSSQVLPVSATASVTELSTAKPGSIELHKAVLETNTLPNAANKPFNKTLLRKVARDAEPAPINEFATRHPFSNGNSRGLSSRVLGDPESMNSKDLDEVSREPSPGFDVLVDDKDRDSDCYAEHEPPSTERNQDPYEPQKGLRLWDQDQTLTERMSSASHYKKGPYNRHAQIDESDLRHRLIEHKKLNGLRSVISHEHAHEFQVGELSYMATQWDEHHASTHENSVAIRLRGRIRLPVKSTPSAERNLLIETDHGSLSPPRTKISLFKGRAKMRSRIEEAFTSVEKNNSAFQAGPKSLSELKGRQNMAPSRQPMTHKHVLGKRKSDGVQQRGSGSSFEGPKSLQEILKRKRGETNGIAGDMISGNNEEMMKAEDTEITLVFESAKLEPVDERHTEEGLDIESKAYEDIDGEGEEEYEYGEDDLYEAENRDVAGEEYADDDDDDFAKKMGIEYS